MTMDTAKVKRVTRAALTATTFGLAPTTLALALSGCGVDATTGGDAYVPYVTVVAATPDVTGTGYVETITLFIAAGPSMWQRKATVNVQPLDGTNGNARTQSPPLRVIINLPGSGEYEHTYKIHTHVKVADMSVTSRTERS